MRRACLPLLLLSFGTCAPEQDREAYVRARKDGGWDAHCDAAYARLTGAARPASLRPEAIRFGEAGLAARVTSLTYLGAATRAHVEADGADIAVLLPKGAPVPEVGAEVGLVWDDGALHPMEDEDG